MDNRPRRASNATMTDRALIDRFTNAVLNGDATSISDYFATQDIRPPTFRWNPDTGTLGEAPLEVLLKWWLSKRSTGSLPSIDVVDPQTIKVSMGAPFAPLLAQFTRRQRRASPCRRRSRCRPLAKTAGIESPESVMHPVSR